MLSRIVFCAVVVAGVVSPALCDEPKSQSSSDRAASNAARIKRAFDEFQQAVGAANANGGAVATSQEEAENPVRPLAESSDKRENSKRGKATKQVQIQIHYLDMPTHDAVKLLGLEDPAKAFGPQRSIRSDGDELVKQIESIEGVQRIAEPCLVTTAERPANFVVGGEFPVPVPTEDNKTNIEWREFGTRCEVVPILLDGGRIALEFQLEVSEQDHKNSVNVNGTIVPGLTSRRINTRAEFALGETLALTLPVPPGKPADRATPEGKAAPAMMSVILVKPAVIAPIAAKAKNQTIRPVSGEVPVDREIPVIVPAAK